MHYGLVLVYGLTDEEVRIQPGREPAYQGKGLTRKMLDPFLGYLDRIGASAYLETHDAANVPLYEHFGFELAEVGCLPGTDIKHYGMIRRAQPKSGKRCL